MAWGKASSTTLSSAGDSVSSGTFTASKCNQSMTHISDVGGQLAVDMRFNSDTGNNYAFRRNNDGGTDATTAPSSHITLHSSEVTEDLFSNLFIINISSDEKLVIGRTIQNHNLGAGNVPKRKEFVGKWANTSSQITQVDFSTYSGSGDYATGSNLTVLGSEITPVAAITFPTNVQLGSRAEITDSRKMYYYTEPSQNFASVLSTYAPQFFLKLDEGSGTALTNSGSNSGYTASITVNNSNPVWDAGVDGANKALKFTDNSNVAYIGHTNLPTESTGDNFTMGLTFKVSTDFTSGDANHHHLWKWNNGGLGFWQMNMTNDGYIGSAYYNGGWQHSIGTTDASDNAWHTFFVTCTSGSSLIGYLDGVQEYTGTMNRSGYAGNDVDWIGHNGGNGVISYDNVFFKNTVMTASEISSLHTLLVPPTTNQWKEIGT